jgi:hypothetical protein
MFGITTIGSTGLIGEILFSLSISYIYENPSDVQFNQNHIFQTNDITYKVELSHSTINQLHVLFAPDNINVSYVPIINFQQNHLFTGEYITYNYEPKITNFSQNHIIQPDIIKYQYLEPPEVQFNQNHILSGVDIEYQNVGRTPFVNPSIVRVVFANENSANELDIEFLINSVEILPSDNKYK